MIGIVSDIHANHLALEAVLADMPDEVDKLVCCGDIVGYGPHPAACIRKIRDVADVVVQGNHDRYVVDPRDRGIPGLDMIPRHSHLALSESDIRWLQELPKVGYVDGYLVIHDWTKRGDGDMITDEMDNIPGSFDEMNGVLMGHQHRQELYNQGGKLFLCPGPVGEPRPSKLISAPLSVSLQPKYAVVDPEHDRVTFRQTDYVAESVRRWLYSLFPAP